MTSGQSLVPLASLAGTAAILAVLPGSLALRAATSARPRETTDFSTIPDRRLVRRREGAGAHAQACVPHERHSLRQKPRPDQGGGLWHSHVLGGLGEGGTEAGQGATGMSIADSMTSPDLEFSLWKVLWHGAGEKVIRPVEKAGIVLEPSACLSSMKPGEAVPAAAFEEELEARAGARATARFGNGKSAMMERPFGKGKAILVGSFVALACQRQQDPATKRLMLAQAAGVSPEVLSSARELPRWKSGA